jgi:hypothetical protein
MSRSEDMASSSQKGKFGVTLGPSTSDVSFGGRPQWIGDAKKMNLSAGQDRRHVVGYDDVLKPASETIFGLARNQLGDDKFKNEMEIILNVKNKNKTTSELMELGLKQLNSAPGNLKPERSDGNQSIEVVRQQGKNILEAFKKPFETDDHKVINFTKKSPQC